MYKQLKIKDSIVEGLIVRMYDNAFIPFDPANADYQQYLKWVAEGNQPLLAEE